MYVLDSDHLTILQRTRGPEFVNLQQRLGSIPETDVFVTIVSFHEQIGGWNKLLAKPKSQRDVVFAYDMLRKMLGEFAAMQVLPFDEPASDEFLALRRQRVRVGTMDLRIAAITKVQGMKLLTKNTVDFERVSGLRFEDWTVGSTHSDV